jgi:hypothetical protein
MRYLVLVLLILSAHFALTPFAPAPKAWIGWPFAIDSKPWLGFIGGLPSQPGSLVTTFLAGLAGLGFLAAAVGLFWQAIPTAWWPVLVIGAAVSSALVFVLYFGVWALVPLALDVILILGVTWLNWSAYGFRGGN